MKKLVYKVLGHTFVYNSDTDSDEQVEILCPRTRTWNETNEEIAKCEAYNGEYTIEDDGIEEISTPSQLDMIEAQVTYTAMMTDTLMEV